GGEELRGEDVRVNGAGRAPGAEAAVASVTEHVTITDVSAGYVPPGDIALELRGLRSGYGLVEVLRGIDLAVPEGHITALLGPNGAGKSTTCLTAAGRINATSGAVLFKGQ